MTSLRSTKSSAGSFSSRARTSRRKSARACGDRSATRRPAAPSAALRRTNSSRLGRCDQGRNSTHVEQDERHHDHVVGGRRERKLRCVRHNTWESHPGTAQHALGPVSGDDQRGRRGPSKRWQQRPDTSTEIKHAARGTERQPVEQLDAGRVQRGCPPVLVRLCGRGVVSDQRTHSARRRRGQGDHRNEG
jgi:hypothetical protein